MSEKGQPEHKAANLAAFLLAKIRWWRTLKALIPYGNLLI